MLLESAFYKLPELMSDTQNSGQVEASVVQYLANALQMEINSRSAPFSYNLIFVEEPYPIKKSRGSQLRADLLFYAGKAIPSTSQFFLKYYGFRVEQWLEAKTFFRSSGQAKTQNLGKIVKDIMRLCLLPEEFQGKNRNIGRYLLLVFDKHPRQYLAISNRQWAEDLINKEKGNVEIDLSVERDSVIKQIVNRDQLSCLLKFSFKRYAFEPCQDDISSLYWGYLYRIEEWSVSIDGDEIESTGAFDEEWPKEKIEELDRVRSKFLKLLRKDEQ
jgi:hypothetical protein